MLVRNRGRGCRLCRLIFLVNLIQWISLRFLTSLSVVSPVLLITVLVVEGIAVAQKTQGNERTYSDNYHVLRVEGGLL